MNRSKTPVINPNDDIKVTKKISNIVSNVNTTPGFNLATVGVSKENVQNLIDYPYMIRIMLIISAIAVYAICLMLFLTSFEFAKNTIRDSTVGGTKIPSYMFNPIFVVPFLTVSIAGFIYILIIMKFRNSSYSTAIFTISSFVYLVGFCLCFARFYFNPSFDTAAPQIFSFMFVSSMVMISLIVTQESHDFLFSLIAALPSLVFGCFYVYYGGKLAN